MLKKLFILQVGIILVLAMVVSACVTNQDDNNETEDQNLEQDENIAEDEEQADLLIYTSIYPVYFFASEIVGEMGTVRQLIPAGAEPHDYEPGPQDIVSLSKADLFIYNGAGFEGWLERLVEAVNNPELSIIDSSQYVTLLTNEETGHDHDHEHEEHGHNHDHDHEHEEHGHNHDHDHEHEEHGHDHDHEHEHEEHGHDHAHEDDHEELGHDHAHDHGEFDPHFWIDPNLAKLQAEAIKNAIVELDPANQDYYQNNFALLVEKLDDLDEQLTYISEQVERRDFVVSHAAFGYIASRYNFNQIAISGLSPAVEPSPQQLQAIIEFVEENEIQYILFENMVTPKVAEVVRESANAESLILHNLEGLTEQELGEGKDYFSIMQENVEVLKLALGYTE